MTPEYLRPKDVSAMTTIPVSTLANWRAADQGPPHVKACGTVLYPKRKLMDWLEADK